jgi:hypothetical protein
MDDPLHADDQLATERLSRPGMPKWVKWSLVVVGVLIAALVVSVLLGVRHGPGMHSPGGVPASTAPGGHRPPGDHG